MIIIPRKVGESLMIDDQIMLTVLEICGKKVRLGFEYPKGVPGHRRTAFDAIRRTKEVERIA